MFGVAEIAIVGSILTFTVVVAVWEAAEVGAPFNSNAGTAKRLAANVALIIFTPLFDAFCFFNSTAKYPSCIWLPENLHSNHTLP